jgi:hypothetical protein
MFQPEPFLAVVENCLEVPGIEASAPARQIEQPIGANVDFVPFSATEFG